MKRYLLLFLLFTAAFADGAAAYGPYSIGRDKTWMTLNLGNQTVNLNGFTNALVQEIAKNEKLPMQIIDFSWSNLFQSLDDEEVAGVFYAITPSDILKEQYSYSEPILPLGPVIVVKKDSKTKSLDDLQGMIVGVDQYDQSVLIVQKHPSIIIQLYQKMPNALDDLSKGKVDAVLLGNVEANKLVPTYYKGKLKIVSQPLDDYAVRLFTLKGKNEHLISNFNRGLKALKSSNRFEALKKEFSLNE